MFHFFCWVRWLLSQLMVVWEIVVVLFLISLVVVVDAVVVAICVVLLVGNLFTGIVHCHMHSSEVYGYPL